MPTREELKDRAFAEIEDRADELIGLSQRILANPEPGFREFKTAALVGEKFAEMGVPFRSGLGMTGVRGEIIGGSEGPTMAIMGELDSLIVNEHPHADGRTGAAHACGHHCQIAMMLGATMALQRDDVLPHLSGRVVSMAVPAEEYIEIEYRDQLRREGKIEFLGGKPEFIRLGEFDDVHLAMMMHTTSTPHEKQLCLTGTNNGTLAKRIQFVGKGAHAGGSPHLGINALNAATLAMSAIHFNRETFLDTDTVRVHPIITKGGEAVSAVPADVRMETFVRGKTLDAIMDANRKVGPGVAGRGDGRGRDGEYPHDPRLHAHAAKRPDAGDFPRQRRKVGGSRKHWTDQAPDGQYGHGRRERNHAGGASLRGRRDGHRSRRGLRDPGLPDGGDHRSESHGGYGDRPNGGRGDGSQPGGGQPPPRYDVPGVR